MAALFVTVSLAGSAVPGLNEPHYLTKARAFADPRWCSRDFFLTSGNAHAVFFWLTGGATQTFSLETVAMTGRAVSAVLLAAGWCVLSYGLRLTVTSGLLAAAVFSAVTQVGSFSGEWILGGFESKVPAWALVFMAVGVWMEGQAKNCPGWYCGAGVICGLACSLHPVVGGWTAVSICVADAATLVRQLRSKSRFASVKRGLGLFAFAAATLLWSLPGLIPALKLVRDTSVTSRQRQTAAFDQVFWRLKHHLDPTEFSSAHWMFAAACCVGIAAGIFRTRSLAYVGSANDCSGKRHPESRLNHLLGFFAVSAVIALVGVLVGWHTQPAQEMHGWEWRAAILKFYPFRLFDGLLPVTLGLVLADCVQRRFSLVSHRRICVWIAVPFIVATLFEAWKFRATAPSGYTAEQLAEWKQACHWIQSNTAAESLFLTPRESFAFKWYAERAEFVCYKDCPQDAAGILTWNDRLWIIHDWTLHSSSDGNYDAKDLRVLRRETDCDYVITRTLGPFTVEPVWSGSHWRIYAVP